MKIALFGATGGTGQLILSQALQQGHEVTVFVRDSQKLAGQEKGVRVVKGSLPENADQAAQAVRGQDVVISSLGRGASLKPEGLIVASMRVLVPALESQNVKRFIVVSAFGVGDSASQGIPFVPKMFHRTLLRKIYADKAAGEEIIKASRLDYTLVRPTILTDGPKSGTYRAGPDIELKGVPKVSRADVADAVLKIAQESSYARQGVFVSS
jgi:putative NADH-flavin reductase